MYNLFVCGHTGSWSGDPWTVERSRCINTDEDTDGDVAERFGDLDTAQIRELCRFPCIFAFEAWEKAPKFGFIRDVIVLRSRAEVKVKYELIECERFLTAGELKELETQLAIRRWERGRTHWAVKDVDLHRVLLDAKGISLPRRDDVASKVDPSTESATNDDLWKPASAPRLFMSHLASRKEEVHGLSDILKQFGFACFVAHDEIEPSREWRREIERALDSCDILIAYVTPGFSASHWTDQEIGWALGRGVAAISISVDGETPRGFIGSYQAVKRTGTMSDAELSTRVFRAICDAVLSGQRRGSRAVAGKVVPLVTTALGRANATKTALQFHDLLMKVPGRLWTPERRRGLKEALGRNKRLHSKTRSRDESIPVSDVLRRLVDGIHR